jgi:hypothetical protein
MSFSPTGHVTNFSILPLHELTTRTNYKLFRVYERETGEQIVISGFSVQFKAGTTQETILSIFAAVNMEIVRKESFAPNLFRIVSQNGSFADCFPAVMEIQANPACIFIEPLVYEALAQR